MLVYINNKINNIIYIYSNNNNKPPIVTYGLPILAEGERNTQYRAYIDDTGPCMAQYWPFFGSARDGDINSVRNKTNETGLHILAKSFVPMHVCPLSACIRTSWPK